MMSHTRDTDKVNYCKNRVVQAFLADCERAETAETGVHFRVPENGVCEGVMNYADIESIRDQVPERYRPEVKYKNNKYLFRVSAKALKKEGGLNINSAPQEICWAKCAVLGTAVFAAAFVLTG